MNGGHPGSPCIEWDELCAKLGSEPGFLRDLLGVVLDTNLGVPPGLREAARTGDLDRIRTLAHRVKGTAGDLVARSCHDLAHRTETAARDGDPTAFDLTRQLADALDGLLDEVRVRLAK